ncbi:MAG: molybdopterin converting factor subunit 1 [Alphaproteobacteria bacterium]|nr:molybdopterin converting factor subunit 1 [Alphaproteobacteria bacterium]
MNILYFAWLRQKVGTGQETRDLPENVNTVSDLVSWLKSEGPQYEEAFKDVSAIKVAINQEFAEFESSLNASDEVAFFPPVTGG